MARPVPGAPLGFDLVNLMQNGERRTVARFVCYRCKAKSLDLSVVSGQRLNPSLLAQSAERKGWDADSVRKARVICPDCKANPLQNDVESELRKIEGRMATSPTALIPAASAPVVPVREPTADQRSVIRRLLEKHFDEGMGCYLDGYSDQRIAEEIGMPRIVVERLRDAAYGPIRISPETLAARKELDDLMGKLVVLQDDATQWAQQFGEELERVRKQVNELRARVGVKQSVA